MDPRFSNLVENKGILTFKLEGINVSLANALRRTIISDIDTVVIKTFPHSENKANIMINTTRFNNEILKQRLSCIPIHIEDTTMPLDQYVIEVHKKNETDTIDYVTTEDFKVKNEKTKTYLKPEEVKKIFPPNHITKQYIDFVRLNPQLSDQIDGSEIKLTAKMSVSNAKDDAMYNVVSTCSYKNTIDKIAMQDKKVEYEDELRKKGLSDEDVIFEVKNWSHLQAKRITMPDSFDFIVETVGVFPNKVILQKACQVINSKLQNLIGEEQDDYMSIQKSDTTMPNCFDITLKGEDYTIGKILEFYLYEECFNKDKVCTFVGFKKFHPHDDDSIIRIAFKTSVDVDIVKQHLKNGCLKLIQIYKEISKAFEGEIMSS